MKTKDEIARELAVKIGGRYAQALMGQGKIQVGEVEEIISTALSDYAAALDVRLEKTCALIEQMAERYRLSYKAAMERTGGTVVETDEKMRWCQEADALLDKRGGSNRAEPEGKSNEALQGKGNP